MRQVRCPVCGHDGLFNVVEMWKEYTLYECGRCDLVFSYPMEGPGREWYECCWIYNLGRAECRTTCWYHDFFLHGQRGDGQRLLDVGCGTGGFLARARELGFNVVGIDFDRRSVELAKSRFGLSDIFSGSLAEFFSTRPDERFDIVTCFEVLEHMADPNEFIALVRRALKPGGQVALSVPNRSRVVDGFSEGDYPPNHLTRWSAASLRGFLERNGFEIEKLRVKPLGGDDVAGWLNAKVRYRVGRALSHIGGRAEDSALLARLAALTGMTYRLFRGLTLPLVPFLKLASLQGAGLFCVARVRGRASAE